MTSLPVTRDVIRTESKSAGRLHTVIADPNLFIVAAVGAIAFTRMPCFWPSIARVFISPTSAILAAP